MDHIYIESYQPSHSNKHTVQRHTSASTLMVAKQNILSARLRAYTHICDPACGCKQTSWSGWGAGEGHHRHADGGAGHAICRGAACRLGLPAPLDARRQGRPQLCGRDARPPPERSAQGRHVWGQVSLGLGRCTNMRLGAGRVSLTPPHAPSEMT